MSRPPNKVAVTDDTSAVAMLFLASDDRSFVAGGDLLTEGGTCSV